MGCVFSPNIPCKKYKKTKKRTKKQASKIIIREEVGDKEYEINRLISKIPGHQKWTIIWFQKCQSPTYRQLMKISEIEFTGSRKRAMRGPRQDRRIQRDFTELDVIDKFNISKKGINIS